MPTHIWGDENVDWEGINDAAEYIATFCSRWGRLGGQHKEKWGEVRFYPDFCHCFLNLTHPGYVHYGRYPKWLMTIDIYYGPSILKYSGLMWFLSKWQPFIYSLAYNKAIKKWPHLRAEILCGADHPELIRGATRKEGNKLHILGWNGEVLSTWETFKGE